VTTRAGTLIVLVCLATGCAAPANSGTSQAEPPGTASAVPTSSPLGPTETPRATPSTTATPEALRWDPVDAADGPSAREDHTWTVSGDERTALLFGGRDGATVYDDLWAYDLDGDAWRRLATNNGPAARFGHEATWVDGVGLVVFAGQAGASFFNDLWAYDPDAQRWTQLPATGDVPVARYGTCAALGPDGRLWISHGFTAEQARFSDTRAYDFESGAWTDESPAAGARPVERCLHGCWWTDDGELALYAGQTTGTLALADRWSFADGSWTEVAGSLPPDRNLYARARVDGGTVVFGGQALEGDYRNDLWLLADGEADALPLTAAGDAPAPRSGAEIVQDPTTDRMLLFGGRNDEGALSDVWALHGSPSGS
jgi:hypothetical protein